MTDSCALLQPWQVAWRMGFLPGVSDAGLHALRSGLETNDPRLIQGQTTVPGCGGRGKGQAIEGACLLGFCAWQGDGLQSCAEVEEYFARLCLDADFRLGEPAACRRFLNHVDMVPREQMRREMLGEVTIGLVARHIAFEKKRQPGLAARSVESSSRAGR